MNLNKKNISIFVDVNIIKMALEAQILAKLIAILEQMNLWDANAKTISELPEQAVLDLTSMIHVSVNGNSQRLSIQKIIDSVAAGNYNRVVSIGEISLSGNVLSVPGGASWIFSNTAYTTESETTETVPFTASGKKRIDILVGNTSSQIIRITGTETTGIARRPNTPSNTVLITDFTVYHTSIDVPTVPITGYEFVNKNEKIKISNADTGEIDIHFPDQRAIMFLTGSVTKIKTSENITVYPCKEYVIINHQSIDTTIEHLSTTGGEDTRFLFPGEADFTLKAGESAKFLFDKINGEYFLLYVGKVIVATSEIVNDGDGDSPYATVAQLPVVNERYKGTYTSAGALSTAHPTANSGDYAVVDTGTGSPARQYLWDAQDGWVMGSDITPATTDNVTEGGTNKYFTAARVLATILSGLSAVTGGPVVSTDTVLVAFGKIKKDLADIFSALDTKLEKNFIDEIVVFDGNDNIQNQIITLNVGTYVGKTIEELRCMSESGTGKITLSIDGAPITGITAVTASDSFDTFTSTANNSHTEGTRLTMEISEVSSLNKLSVVIKTKRIV